MTEEKQDTLQKKEIKSLRHKLRKYWQELNEEDKAKYSDTYKKSIILGIPEILESPQTQENEQKLKIPINPYLRFSKIIFAKVK